MYIFTLYRTLVIILTPLLLHTHIHSTVKLCRKGVLQAKREAFFKKMGFQIFLEREERWRAADICKKRVPDFSCLKVEKAFFSRFKLSFGEVQRVGWYEAVLKGMEEEISQSARKLEWQFCSGSITAVSNKQQMTEA